MCRPAYVIKLINHAWLRPYAFHIKGQLISKCLFGIFNSPKKRTKKFDFTTMVTQVELLLFVFREN